MYSHAILSLIVIGLTGSLPEDRIKCSIQVKSSKIPPELIELTQLPLEYSCPRSLDPLTFTECCNNGDCCEPTFLTPAPNYDWILMVTGILVISSCLILTVLSVICCFWSKCPLYNTCRPNYSTSNVIVYSLGKDDPTPLMPGDGVKGGVYKPCAVKIKKVQEV